MLQYSSHKFHFFLKQLKIPALTLLLFIQNEVYFDKTTFIFFKTLSNTTKILTNNCNRSKLNAVHLSLQLLYIQMRIEDEIKNSKPIPIEQKTVINLMFTGNVVKEQINRSIKHFDLSIEQYNVLRILRGQKGNPANLSTIQERMINKMSNTTRLIDKLLKKELVTRHTCELNRRKVEILITEKGLSLMLDIDSTLKKSDKKATDSLSKDEMETLNSLLDKLRT